MVLFSCVQYYYYSIIITERIEEYTKNQAVRVNLFKQDIEKDISISIKNQEYIARKVNSENNSNLFEVIDIENLPELKFIGIIEKDGVKNKIISSENYGFKNDFIQTLLDFKNDDFTISLLDIDSKNQLIKKYYELDYSNQILVVVIDLTLLIKNLEEKYEFTKGEFLAFNKDGKIVYNIENEIIGKNVFSLDKNYDELLNLDNKMISKSKGSADYNIVNTKDDNNNKFKKYITWETVIIEDEEIVVALSTFKDSIIENILKIRDKIMIMSFIFMIFIVGFGIVLYKSSNKTLLKTINRLEIEYNEKANEIIENTIVLEKLNNKLYNVFEYGNIVFYSIDSKLIDLIDISGPVYKLTGYETVYFLNNSDNFRGIIHNEDKLRVEKLNRKKLNSELNGIINFEFRIICKNGDVTWIREFMVPIYDNNKLIRYDGLFIDINEKKEVELNLEKTKKNLNLIIDAIPDMVILLDDKGNYVQVFNSENEKSIKPVDDLIGKNISEVLSEEFSEEVKKVISEVIEYKDDAYFEYFIDFGDERLFYEAHMNYYKNIEKNKDGIISVIRNITKRKVIEKNNIYLSFHDQMTKLYNRRYFENEIERYNKSRELPISIIVGDLDNLKYINDNYGHKIGDKYLKEIARIFNISTRNEDIVSRIGGDEFAVVLPHANEEVAQSVIQRIKAEVKYFNGLRVLPENLSVSLGLAIKSEYDIDLNEIFRIADRRMYIEKNKKKMIMKNKEELN